MRRRLLTIAIFLLAGAVVNVAVAWGLALFWGQGNWTTIWPEWEFDPDYWPSPPPTGFSFNPTGVDIGWAMDVYCLQYGTHLYVGATDRTASATFLRVGWPCRTVRGAMWVRTDQDASGRILPTRRFFCGALDVRIKGFLRPLPYKPLWAGSTANTIFYAGILWLLIPGPFFLRRLIRRRRGLCLACGYDLRHGAHEACPECGGAA